MFVFYRLNQCHLTGVTNDLSVDLERGLKAAKCSTRSRRNRQSSIRRFSMTNILMWKLYIIRILGQKMNPHMKMIKERSDTTYSEKAE